MKSRHSFLLWAVIISFGTFWAFLPLLQQPTDIAEESQAEELEESVEPVQSVSVEVLQPPTLPNKDRWKSNPIKPMKDWYFPPLPPSLYIHNLPCIGIRDWPTLPPKPLPPNPRFVLLIDSWERQQTGLKTVENAATIAERFDLVFVLPNVRMSNIQGIPGWTQWQSSHALDGFTPAKYLLPMWEYFDLDFTRGHLRVISFDEYMELNNYTITTALMLDWEKDNCRNKPEWYPAYGARIQATQLYCMEARYPSRNLTHALIDKWLTPGSGIPIPEAVGRLPPKYPSVAFMNWRKCSFGSGDWSSELWGGRCRFRWARKWNETAVAWAKENLPDRYVAIKIRSGNWLRWFWLPKRLDDVKICFDHMAQAAKYYNKMLGLPEDAPVYLSTEWPSPPESRWHFGGVSILTASFNSLYKQVNTVTYRNKAYDIGIVTIISFNLLINAAVVVAFEDTMMEFARMYNPNLPVALVGTQSLRVCNIWNPAGKKAKPKFLYLVQGRTFAEKPHYSVASEVICLTWGNRTKFCDFQPGTTWTSGRNYLWKKAVRLPVRFEYYIFLDDDTSIWGASRFEISLMRWRPAIGVPGWAIHLPQPWGRPQNRSEVLVITAFQGFINAFHRDVFFESLVLPYYDGMDEFSWWSSQLYTIYLSNIFHRGEIYGFQRVMAGNDKSGDYPKRWDLDVMNKPFTEECIPDEKYREEHWKGFQILAEPINSPLSPDRRHTLPNATIQNFVQQETKWWQRIRQIRQEAFGHP